MRVHISVLDRKIAVVDYLDQIRGLSSIDIESKLHNAHITY